MLRGRVDECKLDLWFVWSVGHSFPPSFQTCSFSFLFTERGVMALYVDYSNSEGKAPVWSDAATCSSDRSTHPTQGHDCASVPD
eukprot:2397732-Alexandrium_andersonii.AAC.1